jgi:hypothetical protein
VVGHDGCIDQLGQWVAARREKRVTSLSKEFDRRPTDLTVKFQNHDRGMAFEGASHPAQRSTLGSLDVELHDIDRSVMRQVVVERDRSNGDGGTLGAAYVLASGESMVDGPLTRSRAGPSRVEVDLPGRFEEGRLFDGHASPESSPRDEPSGGGGIGRFWLERIHMSRSSDESGHERGQYAVVSPGVDAYGPATHDLAK